MTYGLDRPLVIGQMLGETTRDRLVRSSGLRPGHALLLTKGLGIEATAIIAREKRAQLRNRGCTPAFLDTCADFLHTPGISVVRDAQVAVQAGRHYRHARSNRRRGSPPACGNWPPRPP